MDKITITLLLFLRHILIHKQYDRSSRTLTKSLQFADRLRKSGCDKKILCMCCFFLLTDSCQAGLSPASNIYLFLTIPYLVVTKKKHNYSSSASCEGPISNKFFLRYGTADVKCWVSFLLHYLCNQIYKDEMVKKGLVFYWFHRLFCKLNFEVPVFILL